MALCARFVACMRRMDEVVRGGGRRSGSARIAPGHGVRDAPAGWFMNAEKRDAPADAAAPDIVKVCEGG